MQDMFNLIENDQYACEFARHDFSQISKLKFDDNSNFIICYGSTQIMMFPID